jgi:putative ABC transport system substrate-binding protein
MCYGEKMRRREFITLLGGAAAWPLVARAQTVPVIGFLNTGSLEAFARPVDAFRHGLSETGYIDGQNVAIDFKWANGRRDSLPTMAADLVRRAVNVIAATGGSPAALAAKAATTSIPIVFQVGVDPIKVGLVSSLNRPGGNITGATMLAADLVAKRLELLHELVPGTSVIAALINPTSPAAPIVLSDLEAAAQRLGLQVRILHASSERDFEPAFASVVKHGERALMIGSDPLFNTRSRQLGALTVRYKVPAIYQFHDFTDAGGLASYSGSLSDAYRIAGVYTGRVLKGERPADLPVQQATKIELIINLKTATALGLTVSLPLLGRADEIIE